jgi:maltose alpha-D-glucosyltransferase/alpha-amylase
VEEQEGDSESFLNFMRGLIWLRQSHPDLGNYSPFAVYSAERGSRLFAYKRGNMLLAVNPGREALQLKLDGGYKSVYTIGGTEIREDELTMQSQSFVVLQPKE